jgi:hypothetical protein
LEYVTRQIAESQGGGGGWRSSRRTVPFLPTLPSSPTPYHLIQLHNLKSFLYDIRFNATPESMPFTNLVDKVPHGGLQLALWGSALHDFILNARIAIHVNSHFVINIDIYHH